MVVKASDVESVVSAANVFTADQVERAREYHRPLYVALLADLALGLTVLALLAVTPLGDALFAPLDGLPWWGAAALYPTLVVGLSTVLRLSLAYYRGFVHEGRWGFTKQTPRGWLVDRAKGLGVGLVMTTAALFGLVAAPHVLPSAWPLAAAAGAAIFVVATTFLAPILIEPLFSRFRPVPDAALAAELRSLSRRAGVPVSDVLVVDASRRTSKANAYVSGLGKTRRVVLFDTLLEQSDRREVALVVAHELGHRRARHVVKSTGIVTLLAALVTVAVWALLGTPEAPDVPVVLLIGALLQLLVLPATSAISRRWEREADRFSLELTADPEAFEGAQRELATSNLSDLDPPRLLYLLIFSHPTAPQRIAAARQWATRRAA